MSNDYHSGGSPKKPGAAVTLLVASLVFLACMVALKRSYRGENEAKDSSRQDNLSLFANLEGPKESALFKAERGDSEAQRILGLKYRTGDGVRKNSAEAVRWLRKSAEQGDKLAQFELGEMYLKGEEIEPSVAAGVGLIRRSADQGLPIAQAALGFIYSRGDVIHSRADAIPKDAAQSIRWFTRAASNGDEFSLLQLGLTYAEGIGVRRNRIEAAKWLLQAANNGNPDAQYWLGLIYEEGEGVPKDTGEAAGWYLKAASQGHSDAQHRIGRMYSQGVGLKKSIVDAHVWLNLAAAHGDEAAKELLGLIENKMEFGERAEAMKRARQIFAEQQARPLAAYQLVKLRILALARTAVDGSPDVSHDAQPTAFGTLLGNGSGVIVSESGLVLTAAHVVAGAGALKVLTAQGAANASVLRLDEVNDVAILKLEKGTYPALPIAPSGTVRLGQSVATIGFPNIAIQGFSPKITRGSVSSVRGIGDDPKSWQISVPVQPGNSGGPLLDESGNVVGIVVSKLGLEATKITGDIPQNVNYAVKSSQFLPLLRPFLSDAIPALREMTEKPQFEDMVSKAQRSAVLILVY
jgi:hypothetical protein